MRMPIPLAVFTVIEASVQRQVPGFEFLQGTEPHQALSEPTPEFPYVVAISLSEKGLCHLTISAATSDRISAAAPGLYRSRAIGLAVRAMDALNAEMRSPNPERFHAMSPLDSDPALVAKDVATFLGKLATSFAGKAVA
jgi:hypothetical protein